MIYLDTSDLVRLLLARISLVELDPAVLQRALQPFTAPTLTIDALHLATAGWLRERGGAVHVATYDRRLATASAAIGLDLMEM